MLLVWVPDPSDAPVRGFLGVDHQKPPLPRIRLAPVPPLKGPASSPEAPLGVYRARHSTLHLLTPVRVGWRIPTAASAGDLTCARFMA